MLLAGAPGPDSPALSRVPRLRKSSDYSENLINSATKLRPRLRKTDTIRVTASGPQIVPTTKTVIVADDTAFVRDRFATALLSAGHTAFTVKSAAELLARVRADLAQIDLIVLDLRLPHAGGVELVRTIRKIDQGRLPILVFSGTIATADEVRDLAGAGGRRLRQRVQRRPAHPAVARARTCFPTTSTAAAARASSSAFPSPTASATPSPRR